MKITHIDAFALRVSLGRTIADSFNAAVVFREGIPHMPETHRASIDFVRGMFERYRVA